MIEELLYATIIISIVLVLIVSLIDYLKQKGSLTTYVLEVANTHHAFLPARRVADEKIIIYADRERKKAVETLYCGAQPILMDTRHHPDRFLRRAKKIALFYRLANEPFVRSWKDGSFVDQQRKLRVIEEQGRLELHRQYPMSDEDFCRADFQRALHIDAVKQCQEASDITEFFTQSMKYLLISGVILTVYFFFSFDTLQIIFNFLGGLIK